MAIPLTIFTLHRFAGAGCAHDLLLRVRQPEWSNADEGEHGLALDMAERKRRALIALYEAEVLAKQCGGAHDVTLAGELQAYPVGDELMEGAGGRQVDLWVAETRYGAPWVVMGTAADEDAFWREAEGDDDLASLGPVRPAVMRRAFFLAERTA